MPSLRILLIMDPFIRVPPRHYGGIERVVADVANGLHQRGHKVTLWAAPGSQTQATVVPFGREAEWSIRSNLRNIMMLSVRLWRQRRHFDVIHNFGRLAYLTSILWDDVAKMQTYMRTVNPNNIRKVRRLGARRLHYTAVSGAIRDTGLPGGGLWSVVYNCAPLRHYRFCAIADAQKAPLVFLGRLERCKGVHTAIAVARRLHRSLRIAGTVSSLPEEQDYFAREIEPHIDGTLVSYIGPVNDEQKNELLGTAAALLLPIEWEEPFPVVLPEALLCGTPIIAFRRGGVPEGIIHGQTGFLCDSLEDMMTAIGRLSEIDRARCRAEAEHRFSDVAVVSAYERLYQQLLI